MNKLIFLISIFFLSFALFFSINNSVYAGGCDYINQKLECGGWGGCTETGVQSKCIADCDGWAFPLCDCGEESICWCICVNDCADQWCKGLGKAWGQCQNGIGQCYDATETSCQDGIDNDGDGDTDCADTIDCPDGTSCAENKICKDGRCIQKPGPNCAVSLSHCESAVSIICFCGTKEIDPGMFCCAAENKGYYTKTSCEAECDEAPAPPEEEEITPAPPSPPFPPAPFGIKIENPLTAQNFEDVVDGIIDFLFHIAIVLVPLMVIIGGGMLVTAGGDTEQVKKAKNLIMWALIGFFIVLLSKGFLAIIKALLGVK